MQATGEHEEDISALEASIPLYDAALAVLTPDAVPLVSAMVSANRAAAMRALAEESDYLDMAETSAAEFDRLSDLFRNTDFEHYASAAEQKAEDARELAGALQV